MRAATVRSRKTTGRFSTHRDSWANNPPVRSLSLRGSVTKTAMDLDVIKMESVQVGDAMLPVGQSTVTSSVHLKKLEPSTLPGNSVVGVCHPKNVADYERTGAAASISGGSVAGFLHLVGVEEGDKDGAAKMTFTSPVDGAMPSSMVITGEGVTWLNG